MLKIMLNNETTWLDNKFCLMTFSSEYGFSEKNNDEQKIFF